MWRAWVGVALLCACRDDAPPPVESAGAPPAAGEARATGSVPSPWPDCTGCECTSTGLVPLTGSGEYQGRALGLYGSFGNGPPAAHAAEGLALAQAIVPRDVDGAPDPDGAYVLVSIGMSNTTQEFSVFVELAEADVDRDPTLVVVDGAQGARTAGVWADPAAPPWNVLDERLAAARVTGQQVAVAWVKLANPFPSGGFPAETDRLAADTVKVLQNLRARFPNLALAYLSSRIYAGFASDVSGLNPEPYAYESGFAVQDVVLRQIRGDAALAHPDAVPWIAWGPYLWADGTRAGWMCEDFERDGTHPSASGRRKVAERLLDFVRTDPSAREWYLARP